MPRLNDPFLGLGYGWNPGENGWGTDGYNQLVFVLSLLSSGGVEAIQATPPVTPDDKHAFVVAKSGTGDWYQKDDSIAYRYNGAWQFITPKAGMLLLIKNRGVSGEYFRFTTNDVWEKLETGGGGGVEDLPDTAKNDVNYARTKNAAGVRKWAEFSGGGGGVPDVTNSELNLRSSGAWAMLAGLYPSKDSTSPLKYTVVLTGGANKIGRFYNAQANKCDINFSYTEPTSVLGVHMHMFGSQFRPDGVVRVSGLGTTPRTITVNMATFTLSITGFPDIPLISKVTDSELVVLLSSNDQSTYASVSVLGSGGVWLEEYNGVILNKKTTFGNVVESVTPVVSGLAAVLISAFTDKGGAAPIVGSCAPVYINDFCEVSATTTCTTKGETPYNISTPTVILKETNAESRYQPTPTDLDDRVRAVINGEWVDITDRLNPPKPAP